MMPRTPKYSEQNTPNFTTASFVGIVGTRRPILCKDYTSSNVPGSAIIENGIACPEPATLQDTDRERILLEAMPAVRFIARRIHSRLPQHVDLDDLMSAGVVGLMDAFNKFDHTKKTQFKTYAQFRIRGAILDTLRSQDWSPRDLRRKGRLVGEAVQNLIRNLNRKPSEQEVANHLHMSLCEYQKLLDELRGLEVRSLNAELSPDTDEGELAHIAGSPDESPLIQCLQGEKKQHVIEAIEKLPERERLVLTLYYYEELTMKQVGSIIGIVESRVSQIHTSALRHLRFSLEAFHQTTEPGSKKSSEMDESLSVCHPLGNAGKKQPTTAMNLTYEVLQGD